jgi:transposase
VREFYAQLPRPVLVGIEAIGPMRWFLDLLRELGIKCQVGDAAKIRAAEPASRNMIAATPWEQLGNKH